MANIVILRPDDMHVHLREGEMLKSVLPYTTSINGRALVMPNTTKPILTGRDALEYRRVIEEVAPSSFTPLMTIKLTGATTPKIISEARTMGVVAAKLYPEGVTTNSEDGVKSIENLYPTFEAMQRCAMTLCIHGESPGVFTLDRETHYLKTVFDILRDFSRLKVVLEHVTTADAVKFVNDGPDNLAATITVHHMFLTLDDVIGGMLKPHLFCKPVAKRSSDRDALLLAAFSGNPKYFLGTDSAPHMKEKKECASGCAGVYTAPVAMPCLVELMERHGFSPKALESFTSRAGARFYGLHPNEDTIEMTHTPWTVSATIDGVVPFRAGDTLDWQLSGG